MSDENNNSRDDAKHIDVSLAPYGKAVETATKGVLDGASAFLGRVCLPALDEVGGIFKDRVSYWRQGQALKLIQKWEKKLNSMGGSDLHAPPRLIETALDRGSLVDSEQLQDMWAGLLASACTVDGTDDSNLIFMTILDQLTVPQAKILQYACEHADKKLSANGLIYCENLNVTLESLLAISEIDDIQRLDLELDQLRTLEIFLRGGFPLQKTGDPCIPSHATITPSTLAIQFYVRCQATSNTAIEYFSISPA